MTGLDIYEEAQKIAYKKLDKFALEIYIDYTNNYLTMRKMCEDYSDIEENSSLSDLIITGKQIWEEALNKTKRLKKNEQ